MAVGTRRPPRLRTQTQANTVTNPKTLSVRDLQLVAINRLGTQSRLIVKQHGSNAYQQLRIGDHLAGGIITGIKGRKIAIKTPKGLVTVNLSQGSRL